MKKFLSLLVGRACVARGFVAGIGMLAAMMPVLAAERAAAPVPTARVIVKFKGGGALMRESALAARRGELAHVQHAARLAQRFGFDLRDGSPVAPGTQVLHARGVSSAELVARLKLDPDVEYAEVDARVYRAAAPNDPLYAANQPINVTPSVGQWYLRPPTSTVISAINAEAAWDVTQGSSSVIVAVLDTGIRPEHADLVGRTVPGFDFVSQDDPGIFTTANDNDGRDSDPSDPGDWVTELESNQPGVLQGCFPADSSWHGTQTAALIGAATNNGVGMASVGRSVRILPVRVLGKCGGFTSDVIAGMYWAAGLAIPPTSQGLALGTAPANTNPAQVLNLSLGSADPTCSAAYQAAVNAVTAAGVSVVVSAGNDAGRAVGRPANCNGVIAVGGLRHIGTKVGFSDVGPQVDVSAPGGNCVTLNGTCQFPILTATNSGTTTPVTAPAGSIYTGGGSNASFGTSFSAPLVSGTVGLMLSANAELTPDQLRFGVMTTSRTFPTSGADPGVPMCRAPDNSFQDECYCTTSTCGAGMLDAAAATTAANSLRAWIVPSATQVTTEQTITLDGRLSWAVAPNTITSYQWSLPPGAAEASLQNASSPIASLSGINSGSVVVTLTVSDGTNTATNQVTVNVVEDLPVDSSPDPPPSASAGGGATSWPWLLALAAAVAALRPRRRMA